MLRFSIVMPCHNAESYLDAAISTVRNQTFQAWELICVDDGSTDGTSKLLTEAVARDDRIKVISQTNGGPSAARNRGVADAQGEIIAFLDADDLWASHKLMTLDSAFRQHPSPHVVYGRTAFFERDPNAPTAYSTISSQPLDVQSLLGENPTCTTSNLAVWTDFFLMTGGFNSALKHAEDLAWLLRVTGLGARITGISEILTFYRANQHGLSADLWAMHIGWRRAVSVAAACDASVSPADLQAAEAIHLRYLARRALRIGASGTISLRFAARALALSPSAFFSDYRRGASVFCGAVAAIFMPARLRRWAFGC